MKRVVAASTSSFTNFIHEEAKNYYYNQTHSSFEDAWVDIVDTYKDELGRQGAEHVADKVLYEMENFDNAERDEPLSQSQIHRRYSYAFASTKIKASEEFVPSDAFFNTDVETPDEIENEIEYAIENGTTYNDIEDYLDELVEIGRISQEEKIHFEGYVDTILDSMFYKDTDNSIFYGDPEDADAFGGGRY